jgi:hypothetical protein
MLVFIFTSSHHVIGSGKSKNVCNLPDQNVEDAKIMESWLRSEQDLEQLAELNASDAKKVSVKFFRKA